MYKTLPPLRIKIQAIPQETAHTHTHIHTHTHTPTQTTKPITISSTYVINGFLYSIPLVILYIRSETSNRKLDLKPRLHTRNQDSQQ